MIPKTIVQTSRNNPQQYVVDMIRELSPEWSYLHFTDDEVIKFFIENPLPEFPDVINKFYSFSYGEHRADLFRYYFLFVKGGVYFDTDAMIEENMDKIAKNYDYFSVNSSYVPNSIFQGFIGCVPGHAIIHKALTDIYNTSNNHFLRTPENFHDLCKNMYTFVLEYPDKSNIYLYQEIYGDNITANVIDPQENNKVVLKHYHIEKIIPKKSS
jgi:mannosyltransferase OCH1-like enzyme|uniref:Glycosyltransferase n=1 Tax=viral metagenome TaxID=1070528 RepID=A0A6C0IPB0_9ZZZZ